MRTESKLGPAKATDAQTGFSLIELLIVVAIILVIAAIAIPNLLRSRMAANEASAAENVRTITTASIVYSTTWGNGYAPTLDSLGGTGSAASCTAANLLDPVLATSPYTRSGYVFGYTGQQGQFSSPPAGCVPGFNGYLVTAVPQNALTGTRSFCSEDPAVIHYDLSGAAAASQAACDALPTL